MTANDQQVGGTHYKEYAIQPWDYIVANDIPFLEGNAIKYITRWRQKGGLKDINKAIHCLQKLLEVEVQKEKQPDAWTTELPETYREFK